MTRRAQPAIIAATLLATALLAILSGCTATGGGTTDASPHSAPTGSPAAAVDCPSGFVDAFADQGDATGSHRGSIADLGFPGDSALLDGACVIVIEKKRGGMALATLPGGDERSADIMAAISDAGAVPFRSDEAGTFFLDAAKGSSWVVSSTTSGALKNASAAPDADAESDADADPSDPGSTPSVSVPSPDARDLVTGSDSAGDPIILLVHILSR